MKTSRNQFLFHQFLKDKDKFVDSVLFLACFDVVNNTGTEVFSEEYFVKTVECGVDSGYLDQDIRTVHIVLNHFFDPSYLTFNTAQAVKHIPALLLCALFCPMLACRTDFLFIQCYHAPLSINPHGVLFPAPIIYTLRRYFATPKLNFLTKRLKNEDLWYWDNEQTGETCCGFQR